MWLCLCEISTSTARGDIARLYLLPEQKVYLILRDSDMLKFVSGGLTVTEPMCKQVQWLCEQGNMGLSLIRDMAMWPITRFLLVVERQRKAHLGLLMATCFRVYYVFSLPISPSLSSTFFSTSLQPSTTAAKNLVSSWCLSVESRMLHWRNVWQHSEYFVVSSARLSTHTVRCLPVYYPTNIFHMGLHTLSATPLTLSTVADQDSVFSKPYYHPQSASHMRLP